MIVKGTRDIARENAILLNEIIKKIKEVYEKYGFEPFFTPSLEYAEVLRKKISSEMLGLIYEFSDKAGRKIGLRYDLTLGLARFAASSQLSLPFKRYQIDKAWRYEAPQAGRYREFWQADIDILGVKEEKADAECLACVSEALEKIGIKNFTIRVNSRKLLEKVAGDAGIKKQTKVFQILDKIDKIGEKEAEKLLDKEIGKEKRKNFLSKLEKEESTNDIKNLMKYAKFYDIANRIKIDKMLARGLAYYTGLVFEISAGGNLSIGGGGRWDDLIQQLGGKPTPATGISLGLDRILEILKKETKTLVKICIIPISKEEEKEAIRLTQKLRNSGIITDVALQERSLSKNLDYANKLGIEYVCIIGKKEIAAKKIRLRDMKSGKERLLSEEELIKKLSRD